MKDSKECAKPPKPPGPNLKNKEFVKWSRAESCKREDNIVSTEWHEKLKETDPFVPIYGNKPLNMVYLLSGEYGRLWQKERDEWYTNVFIPKPKEKDMFERRAKIRRQAREAKKTAEKSIKERKERKAKEAEAKTKAEAEKAEKIKAKLQKCAAAKKTMKTPKKKKELKESPSANVEKLESCPKGWTPVELTLQCECSGHDKEKSNAEKTIEQEPNTKQNETPNQSSALCPAYVQQLVDIQAAKTVGKDSKQEPSKEYCHNQKIDLDHKNEILTQE